VARAASAIEKTRLMNTCDGLPEQGRDEVPEAAEPEMFAFRARSGTQQVVHGCFSRSADASWRVGYVLARKGISGL
jgi:hypothetical protein